MTSAPLVELNDGHRMPAIGFGTYTIKDASVIVDAIDAGYRLVDTAAGYFNEAEVGRAIRDAPVPRDELFVTTKLPGGGHGAHGPRRELEASLAKLDLDHVDLYLIHWPRPSLGLGVETWEAFIELRDAGLTRSIGVSNFLPEHTERIVAETGVVPAVNQVELHPYLAQIGQRAADEAAGTVTQSWSPLGRGSALLADPVIAEIAAKHGRTPAQVVLRWHLQIGAAPIPKSATPERYRSNLDVFDFELDADDLQLVAGLETGRRLGGDPRTS